MRSRRHAQSGPRLVKRLCLLVAAVVVVGVCVCVLFIRRIFVHCASQSHLFSSVVEPCLLEKRFRDTWKRRARNPIGIHLRQSSIEASTAVSHVSQQKKAIRRLQPAWSIRKPARREACKGSSAILWMDEIQWFPMVSKWCRISSIPRTFITCSTQMPPTTWTAANEPKRARGLQMWNNCQHTPCPAKTPLASNLPALSVLIGKHMIDGVLKHPPQKGCRAIRSCRHPLWRMGSGPRTMRKDICIFLCARAISGEDVFPAIERAEACGPPNPWTKMTQSLAPFC